jgi:hypothetical protein
LSAAHLSSCAVVSLSAFSPPTIVNSRLGAAISRKSQLLHLSVGVCARIRHNVCLAQFGCGFDSQLGCTLARR